MREYLSLNDFNLPQEEEEVDHDDSDHEGSLDDTLSLSDHENDHRDLFSDSSNDSFPELHDIGPLRRRRRSPDLLEGLILDYSNGQPPPSPDPVDIQLMRHEIRSEIFDFNFFCKNLPNFNALNYLNARFNSHVYMNKPIFSIANDETSEKLPLSIFFNPFDYEEAMSKYVTKLECLEIACLEFYWQVTST